MAHADLELLSLLALGEPVGTSEDRRHLETCSECAEELSELRRVVSLGRSVRDEHAMTGPSPRVWARIRDELALKPAREPLGEAATEFVVEHPQDSLLALMQAALTQPSHGADKPQIRATLAPVESTWSDASGEAVLAIDVLGRRVLQLALRAELPSSGLRQAWLVHREDATRKQSLGILDGSFGVWTVDRSIDIGQYAILDVSEQGASDVEHSGRTIVRGQLVTVG